MSWRDLIRQQCRGLDVRNSSFSTPPGRDQPEMHALGDAPACFTLQVDALKVVRRCGISVGCTLGVSLIVDFWDQLACSVERLPKATADAFRRSLSIPLRANNGR